MARCSNGTMSSPPLPPPVLTSPDGRYTWDGTHWVLVQRLPQSRGLGLRGWAILAGVMVLLVMCGGGGLYASMLTSGPPDLNCIGQAVTIQPQLLSDGSLLFQGDRDAYFTAPMTLAGNWTVTFSYLPDSFKWGAVISGLSVIVLFAVAALEVRPTSRFSAQDAVGRTSF